MAFSDSLNKIWEDWNIRGAVLFSLTMQIVLIALAPFRKLSANRIVTLLVWSAYLLADATATSAVGLIVKTQRYNASALVQTSQDFLAFWVPFLLLHLGGPDTITAFALEDNQLWVRHLLALLTQGIATGYLFLQTFSHNKFRLPTLLLFIAGIIKYMERIFSLYLASRDRFRNSMIRKPKAGGVNYSKSGQPGGAKTPGAGPTVPESRGEQATPPDAPVDCDPQNLSDVEVVAKGHEFFKIFKGLIVDIVFSFKERDESRSFFNSTTPQNAFRIIEAELNFMYEVLYTKAAVVHSLLGSCFRLIASSSVIVGLVIFRFFIKKHGFDKIDIGVTYALLLSAIGLDGLAFFISVFSNWTLVSVFNAASHKDNSFISKFNARVLPVYKWLLDFKKPRPHVCEPDKHTALVTPILFRKWSECVPNFNMVTYCLKGSPVRIHSRMSPVSAHRIVSSIHRIAGQISRAISDVWNKSMCSNNKGIRGLRDLSKKVSYFLGIEKAIKYWIVFRKNLVHLIHLTEILDELTYVSTEPLTMELWQFIFEELKEKSASIKKGEEASKELFSARGDDVVIDKDGINLKDYLGKVSYDESLLLWHIATALLYNGEDFLTNAEYGDLREFSKIIADYMLYILIWRPSMMSTIAGMAKLRYEDTCIDARRFFKRRGLRPEKVRTACKMVLDIDTDFETSDIMKQNESMSVLFKACMLAKDLRKLEEKKWKTVSKIWVELLSYGASHCGATAHAQQLSKGGDLITFVWVLMAHFGLLDQFQPNSCLLLPQEDSSLANLLKSIPVPKITPA